MELNRRSFLRGLLTVAAVSIVPVDALSVGLPRIVGDGIHDDTAGINAAIAGRPFVADGLVIRDQHIVQFGVGTFRMTAPMEVVKRDNLTILGATGHKTRILADHDDHFVTMKNVRNMYFGSGFRFVRASGHENADSAALWLA